MYINMISQAIARYSSAVRRRFIISVRRRRFDLPDRGPIVSFTFDDFPRSAFTNGGAILKSYGARGTYYAAMGLMGHRNELGEHFGTGDLARLLADGHELGSHTFSHFSCRSTSFDAFEADVQKGCEAVQSVTQIPGASHFAYPHGHVTLRVKGRIGPQMNSCRSTFGGVNVTPVDLNLLLANRLYNGTFDLTAIDHLFKVNDRRRGWLIFYTHDVRDIPSRLGCKPGQLEAVVRVALRMRHKILTIGAALETLESQVNSLAFEDPMQRVKLAAF